jgi:xanthosine utilization system XapX-like protein
MPRYMTQSRGNRELWLSFMAAILITAVYAFVVFWTRAIPPAGALFGHLLGILGFILMLLTEILYSIRKRSQTAQWGSMASWLQFHIFTGLIGPYMVLLHSSWKFNGLAGATTRHQRIYWTLYLHADPSQPGWRRNRDPLRAGAGGSAGTRPPVDGGLASDPHPPWDGAIYGCFHPY